MFDVLTIDLTLAFVEKRFVDENKKIGAVTFVVFPAGTSLTMKLGNTQPLPVVGTGVFFGFSDDDGNHGLKFINTIPQPGVIVVVMVGYKSDDAGTAIMRAQ
jgi:hypothetical protein